jgi:hypothetical protein
MICGFRRVTVENFGPFTLFLASVVHHVQRLYCK